MAARKGVRIKATLPPLTLDPKAVEERERRTTQLTLRLTPTERQELQVVADHYHVTVTAYLLGLHRQAMAAMRQNGGRRNG
jgi:hypothetical protein